MPGKGLSTVSKASAILAVTLSVTSGWAVLALLFAEVLSAQTYSVIHNFTGSDGARPYAGLTMDRAGNLYGTTLLGGSAGSISCIYGCGTVYRLSRTSNGWTITILHAFGGPSGDGATSFSRVIFGPDGALYGTTYSGGMGSRGTVFRLYPPAKSCGKVPCPWEESHYSFPADYLSGAGPIAEVAFDAQGDLYGTTDVGGPNYCRNVPNSCGVLFKLTTPIQEWNQSVIWDYEQSSGDSPYGGIIFDASGNIFGVTTVGGSADLGTLYEMTESGGSWTYSVLYNFTGQSDGWAPDGNLLEDAEGNLYGTAVTGGSGGGGTVFEFSPSGGGWNFRVLHSFSGTEGPGGPVAGLTMDANGNLYGTTNQDGAFGFGNVFKLTKSNGSWNYASLHDFSGGADGGGSRSTVLIDAAGNLYGTAVGGGATGDGVVWEITP